MKYLLIILFLFILSSCVQLNEQHTCEWIKNHQKPIICKLDKKKDIDNLGIGYTL